MTIQRSTERKKRVIIKVGTSTLTGGGLELHLPRMVELTRQISCLMEAGYQVVLVTSGGIAAGREVLHHPQLPGFLPAKQMLAAVGQPRLMAIYTQLFSLYSRQIAQVLLTRDDLADRKRYLNARHTLEALLDFGLIPIINENDTVATEEIRFGDNDNLSALVANVLEADLLVLLTDQDGVFTADPRSDPNAVLVSRIESERFSTALTAAAGGSSTGLGTGGMMTKLEAADLARRGGTNVIIANGGVENILVRIVLEKENLGTWFANVGTVLEGRKRFILSGRKGTAGKIWIDDGAATALRNGGSLLPVGVKRVGGTFARGESVTILRQDETQAAVGIANYPAEEIRHIAGKRSDQIEAILGYAYGAEVVHRDNLVLL